MSALGFKARVYSLTYMLPHLCPMDSSDSASGVTPAKLLVTNMVAKPFQSHVLVYKHWWGSSLGLSMPDLSQHVTSQTLYRLN